MRFALVDAAKKEFPVHRLCRVLGVSQSGYSAWKGRPACRRQREDMVLLAHVRSAFALSNGTYGSPRMARELRDSGLSVGRRRTARPMRENGLKARQERRFRRTTDSRHAGPVAPNLLDQDFTAAGPDEKWGADISCIWTREGWLYLAVVIDLFSRKVVGWAMAPSMPAKLVCDALHMAVQQRQPAAGLIVHSDRGSQYASAQYQAYLAGHGFSCSMSRKGNCWDNAVAERFFLNLKMERVWQRDYANHAEARIDIADYIVAFYNSERLHSVLGNLPPTVYERRMAVEKPIVVSDIT